MTETKPKLERCGYCGRWFIDDKYLLSEELKQFTQEQLDAAPLGFGPDAQAEHYQQNPEDFN